MNEDSLQKRGSFLPSFPSKARKPRTGSHSTKYSLGNAIEFFKRRLEALESSRKPKPAPEKQRQKSLNTVKLIDLTASFSPTTNKASPTTANFSNSKRNLPPISLRKPSKLLEILPETHSSGQNLPLSKSNILCKPFSRPKEKRLVRKRIFVNPSLNPVFSASSTPSPLLEPTLHP
jgi:hypothetical protein